MNTYYDNKILLKIIIIMYNNFRNTYSFEIFVSFFFICFSNMF